MRANPDRDGRTPGPRKEAPPDGTGKTQGLRLPLARPRRLRPHRPDDPGPLDHLRPDHQRRGQVLRDVRPPDRPAVDDLHGRLHRRLPAGRLGHRHLGLQGRGRPGRRPERRLRPDPRPLRLELHRRPRLDGRHRRRPTVRHRRHHQDRRALVPGRGAGHRVRARHPRPLPRPAHRHVPHPRSRPARRPALDAADLRHRHGRGRGRLPGRGPRAPADAGREGRAGSDARRAQVHAPAAATSSSSWPSSSSGWASSTASRPGSRTSSGRAASPSPRPGPWAG